MGIRHTHDWEMGDAGGWRDVEIWRKGVELVKNLGCGFFLESHENERSSGDASGMLFLCFIE